MIKKNFIKLYYEQNNDFYFNRNEYYGGEIEKMEELIDIVNEKTETMISLLENENGIDYSILKSSLLINDDEALLLEFAMNFVQMKKYLEIRFKKNFEIINSIYVMSK